MLGWVGVGCVWLFFGVFGSGAGCVRGGVVLGCLGMWGNLLFALVSALCTLVQISIFGGLKSTSRGCFWGCGVGASAFWWIGGRVWV